MNNAQQPLVSHVKELRNRAGKITLFFVISFFSFYPFSAELFNFIAQPLADILTQHISERRFIYTELTEAFVTHLKVTAFFAFLVSWPVISWHVWRFTVPGLYDHERRMLTGFLIASPFLFLIGMLFTYMIVFPNAFRFFLSFESAQVAGQMPIQLEARMSDYLGLCMRLFIVFGLCFQLPIIMLALHVTLKITVQTFLKTWRYSVLGIFLVAAIFTPPDALSMLILAIPLTILYGLSIGLVYFFQTYLTGTKKRHA